MLYFLWCNFDYDNFGILDLNLIFEHNKSVQDIQSHTLHALLLMFYYLLALNQGMCLCCDGMPDEYLILNSGTFRPQDLIDGVAKHLLIALQGVSILATPFADACFRNPTYCT